MVDRFRISRLHDHLHRRAANAPARQNHSDSEWFPCIHSPCGCKTAAQCWDHCCCFNDAQKIAWALNHGVVPPKFVIERHHAEQKSAALIVESKPSCCSEKPNGCSEQASAATASPAINGNLSESVADPDRRKCCQTEQQSADTAIVAMTDSKNGSRVVFWSALQRCRGIDLVWTLLATGWIPDRKEQIKVPNPLLIETYVIEDTKSESIIFAPDPPVPWIRPVV